MQDEWVLPAVADRIQTLYPQAQRVDVEGAGHCPHDEEPEVVNAAIDRFIQEIRNSSTHANELNELEN